MNETVETCGKSYCEHYPDGLFVCAKCREESTIAHDKACAKLADARAEIERLSLSVGELNGSFNARPKCEKCKAKNKLIEQMGRAMEKVIANYRVNLRDLTDFENKQVATLEAALAAERGE